MKRTLLFLSLALGTFGCTKKGDDNAPNPMPQPSLLGHWRAGPEAYVYTNAQGIVTLTTSTRPNDPTTYLNISESVWQDTQSRPTDFLYSRADSIVNTSLLFNGNIIHSNTYTIVKLTSDRLILKWHVDLADGGKCTLRDYYSR